MIGIFGPLPRVVVTIATPTHATAMPSHIVGVGALPKISHSAIAAIGGVR